MLGPADVVQALHHPVQNQPVVIVAAAGIAVGGDHPRYPVDGVLRLIHPVRLAEGPVPGAALRQVLHAQRLRHSLVRVPENQRIMRFHGFPLLMGSLRYAAGWS